MMPDMNPYHGGTAGNYCMRHKIYCIHCGMMGNCIYNECPYDPVITDAVGTEIRTVHICPHCGKQFTEGE